MKNICNMKQAYNK